MALLCALQSGCLTSSTEEAKTKGVGDRLRPFISIDATSGKRYCQVCAFGGRPTLMAVFDLNDPAADGDLALMHQILAKHPKLTAFALFGRLEGGALRPPADPESARTALAQRAKALGLSFPVTVLPTKLTPAESLHYRPYAERFDLPGVGRSCWARPITGFVSRPACRAVGSRIA